jgi:hypothetical protein
MTSFSNYLCRTLLIGLLIGLMSACGGGGSNSNGTTGNNAPSPSSTGTITASNSMNVVVDSGIASSGSVNQLFATVTICQPGSNIHCQTIDHVMVDTGSTGLRVFSAAIPATVNLPGVTGPSGMPLFNCVQFIDNTYAWGSVAKADLVLGGKTAANVPIQIMAYPTHSNPNQLCSSRGRANQITSALALGANGILGLGLFKEDCGADCVTNAANGSYFTCPSAACTSTVPSTASLASQLKQPVALFASDNNGLLIDLPAVAAAGAVQLNGALIFGLDTQPNNQMTSVTVLTTDGFGYITTKISSQSLTTSFIDSGSNGLFFDSASLPLCSSGGTTNGFYCPGSPINLSATLVGANSQTASVNFSITNAMTSFANTSLAVLPTLAGSIGDTQTFDWGLPFFYGRRVFMGIKDSVTTRGTGPFYAF